MAKFSTSLILAYFVFFAGQALAQESGSEDKPTLNPKSLGGQAMAAAQQTGRPVITLGLSESCVYCQKLVQELKNIPITSEFIVVPMNTINNPHWTDWTQSYQPPNIAVPVMFIVRADGKLLHTLPGYSEGRVLPYMKAALKSSGTVLDAAEAKKMNAALNKAKGAHKVGNIEAAISALVPISGTGSYAASAIEADALLAQIVEEAIEEIESAKAKLEDNEKALQGALQLIEAIRIYGRIPEVRESLETLVATYSEEEATKTTMEQAQRLATAERLAADRKKEEAADSLQAIVQDFPGSAAAEMAVARLAELNVAPANSSASAVSSTRESIPPQASSPTGKLRTWSDVTGRYKIEATLQSHTDEKVILKKTDGTLVDVPLAKLSPADKEFVANQ